MRKRKIRTTAQLPTASIPEARRAMVAGDIMDTPDNVIKSRAVLKLDEAPQLFTTSHSYDVGDSVEFQASEFSFVNTGGYSEQALTTTELQVAFEKIYKALGVPDSVLTKSTETFSDFLPAVQKISTSTLFGLTVKVDPYAVSDSIVLAPSGEYVVTPKQFAKLQGFKLGTEDLE